MQRQAYVSCAGLLVILLCGYPLLAFYKQTAPIQVQGKAKTSEKEKTKVNSDSVESSKETNEKLLEPKEQIALGLLQGEIENAKKYKYSASKIAIWTSACDALWDFQPIAARELLKSAFEEIKSATFNEKKPQGKSEENALLSQRGASKAKLRREILIVAQRHDATVVKELAEMIEENKEKATSAHNNSRSFGSTSQRARSMAQLALQLAETDPKESVRYALESVSFGFPEELQLIFPKLIKTDINLAHTLFEKATKVFLADPSTNLYDAIIISSYLKNLTQPEADQFLVRSFLGGALDRIKKVREDKYATGTTDPGLSSAIYLCLNYLQPLYQVYWPEMLLEVNKLINNISVDVPEAAIQFENQFSVNSEKIDIEGLLLQAKNEKDPANKDAIYLKSALLLSEKGEFTRAIDSAMNAKDVSRRDLVLSKIHGLQIKHFLSIDDLYSAEEVVSLITIPIHRVEATSLISTKAIERKNTFLAWGILSKTVKFLESQPESLEAVKAYLWLAKTYCSIDSATGFDLMTSAIKAFNKIGTYEDLNITERKTYLGGNTREFVSVSIDTAEFLEGFRLLSQKDLDRSLLIANQFENELFKGASIIFIAKSLLDSKVSDNNKNKQVNKMPRIRQ